MARCRAGRCSAAPAPRSPPRCRPLPPATAHPPPLSRSAALPTRPGLSARQPLFGGAGGGAPADQLQINIEAGGALDLDDEIDQLRSSVGRLKQVPSAAGC